MLLAILILNYFHKNADYPGVVVILDIEPSVQAFYGIVVIKRQLVVQHILQCSLLHFDFGHLCGYVGASFDGVEVYVELIAVSLVDGITVSSDIVVDIILTTTPG